MKMSVRIIAVALVAAGVAVGAYMQFRPADVDAATTSTRVTVTRRTLYVERERGRQHSVAADRGPGLRPERYG